MTWFQLHTGKAFAIVHTVFRLQETSGQVIKLDILMFTMLYRNRNQYDEFNDSSSKFSRKKNQSIALFLWTHNASKVESQSGNP